jgi:hypothetical protein
MSILGKELAWRWSSGLLPDETTFHIAPDVRAGIGSGGSTISVLHELHEQYGLDGKKLLMIHSGGQSQRLPFCRGSGKVLMPLPSKKYHTMLDWLFTQLSNAPETPGSQVVISPCDSFLRHDPRELVFSSEGITVMACRGTQEEAKQYGHFTVGQKSTENLYEPKDFSYFAEYELSFQEPKPFWIDTGIVNLADDAVSALLSMKDLYRKILGGTVTLSLYNQIYQWLLGAPLLDTEVSGIKFSVNTVRNSTFYHLGSTEEFIKTFCLLSQDRSWEAIHA